MHRITETRQQRKACGALVRIRVVDGHLFKEPVDGRAQGGKRSHRIGEPLSLHRRGSAGGGIGKRVDQRLFGRIGGVGKGGRTIVIPAKAGTQFRR